MSNKKLQQQRFVGNVLVVGISVLGVPATTSMKFKRIKRIGVYGNAQPEAGWRRACRTV
jgi:hypothetical protein